MRQLKTVLEGILAGQDDILQAGDDLMNSIDDGLKIFYDMCGNKSNFKEMVKGRVYALKQWISVPDVCSYFNIDSTEGKLRIVIKKIDEDNPENSYWMIAIQLIDDLNIIRSAGFTTFPLNKAKTLSAVLKKVVQPSFKDIKAFEKTFVKK